MRNPWDWTKEDLDKLIGQAESFRLDFKQSRMFEDDANKIIDNLTREVSAFANTEGGTIVVGIAEKRDGRTRYAERIDEGIDISKWSPEWIQQSIEANIRPHLTGLRIRVVPIDQDRNRCAVVISVPQGTTAYQAKDYLYYGRSEYESKPLPDHEIRLRMQRGKARRASVVLDRLDTGTSCIKVEDNRERLVSIGYSQQYIDGKEDDDEVQTNWLQFRVDVVNDGEINISEFKVRIDSIVKGISHEFPNPIEETVKEGWVDKYPYEPKFNRTQRVNIYPQDSYKIRDVHMWYPTMQSLDDIAINLHWTIYLRDTLPYTGSINVIDLLKRSGIEKS